MRESADDEVIWGRHPVLEALRAGRACRRLVLVRGSRGPGVDELFDLARQLGIPYDLQGRDWFERAGGAGHQGVVAYMAARSYADFEQLLAMAGPEQGFLVFLDGIQDPHNLGAVIRSAHAVGADGVVLPERGAAGLTSSALKAAAGAAEHLPVCRVKNLQRALVRARKSGYWLAGLEAGAEQNFTQVDYRGNCGLVVGGEGRGLRPMVRQRCDYLVDIPMGRDQVGSFNASVAAGLVLYEVYRQRYLAS